MEPGSTLATLGADAKSLAGLLRAPGLVGKTSGVALGSTAVFGVAVWRLGDHPWFVIGALVMMCALFVSYFGATFYFGIKYPHTQLEDLQLLEYFRMQQKDTPVIPPSPETTEPSTPLIPESDDAEKED